MRLRAVTGVVAGLAMVACSADYVEQNQSTVLLLVTSINGGSPILSDVRGTNGQIVNCVTSITIANVPKNPTGPTAPSDNVVLQRYDVSFVRSDGRAIEGVDVPYRFSEPMTAMIPAGGDLSLNIDLVRHQAKLEPPLSNITGLDIVEMTANVTVFGETISRQTVSGSGAAAIRFADFVSGTTTCDAGS